MVLRGKGLGIVCFLFLVLGNKCFAHFGMIIPATDIVESQKEADLNLKVMFAHPFQGSTMNMEKPVQFGVYFDGEKEDLMPLLKSIGVKNYNDPESHQAWGADFKIKRPGDYIFYLQPQAYWEPAEDKFIVHYTKVVVNAFGKEKGWGDELGLKTEIVPLTRPYGVYKGNLFQGQVKVSGKPVPFCEVEVEYYNQNGESKAPKEVFVTQVMLCDENGIFSYSFPKEGWWGFSALNEDENKLEYEGEEKSVEIGAVIWLRVYEME
ncbi:MAG: DUF4198 domain-containing protein [Candidatus Saelkia tenebricola]|nr:DUF4198 domain-containing protein [Candidatus Saelkia tenebricola]